MYIALVYIVLRFSMLCYLSFSIHSHPLLSHCLKTDFKTSLNTSNISWFITIMTENTFLPESFRSNSMYPRQFVHAKTLRVSGEKVGLAL